MNDKIFVPQKNLEDLCKIYAKLSESVVEEDALKITTYLNPGFFYSRNFLTDNKEVDAQSMADKIIENAKEGKPHLTTFTKELMQKDALEVFENAGFEVMLMQYGMIYEKRPEDEYKKDPHIEIIKRDELSEWTDVMIEGFKEDEKVREDVVYEALINSPDVIFFAYKNDGKIAGTSALYFTEDYPGIMELAVPKKNRGQGIATKMVKHIICVAEEMGEARVTLQASSMGRPVYEALGFKQVSEIYNIILSR